MRICFLGDASSVHIHKWIDYFKKLQWEVFVISFKEYSIEGVEVISLGKSYRVKEHGGNYNYLKYLLVIKSIIKRIKPDLVNAHYITSYGFLGALTKSTPLVLSAWGTDILVTPKKNIFYRLLTAFALKRADIITSDAENMTQEIKKLTKRKKIDILTVPMGVDIELFKNDRSFDVSKAPLILSLRTLNNNSNVDLIIKSFVEVLKVYPDARLIIGNDGDSKLQLKDLCMRKSIENKVDFLGFVDRKTIVALLKSSDFYVSVPTSDATSVTLLEAMSAGIYPIVSDIPANGEWIKHNINGSLVDFDSKQISDSIISNYKNISYMRRAAVCNYKLISERANLSENMEKIKDKFMLAVAMTNKDGGK